MSGFCTCGEQLVEDRSQLFCPECGIIYNSGMNLVETVGFDDGGMIGSFVSESGKAPGVPGYQRTSTEMTLERANTRIKELGETLNMFPHQIQVAKGYYQLALSKHATQGRSRDHVIAACLYITCRLEKTEHMLIDVVDALPPGEKTTVPKLGKTLKAIADRLNLPLPLVDPSLYIHRFAAQLEFGDKENAVAETALRFIQRMGRDWIQTGRRPAGVCGAALMMAARLHGFDRTPADIVDVVRIGDKTLLKRIAEFEHTPSVDLTPSQFKTMDLKSSTFPPCYIKGQEKKKKKKKSREETDDKKKTKKRKRKDTETRPRKKQRRELSLIEELIEEQAGNILPAKEVERDMNRVLNMVQTGEIDFNVPPPEGINQTINLVEPVQENAPSGGRKAKSRRQRDESDENSSEASESGESASENSRDKDSRDSSSSKNSASTEAITTTPPGDKEHLNEQGEDTFSDIDDDEIDSYIFRPEDSKAKSLLWHHLNKEFLQQKQQQLREQESDPSSKKKGRKKKTATTAGEAAQQAMERKMPKKSSLINWDAAEARTLIDTLDDIEDHDGEEDEEEPEMMEQEVAVPTKAAPKKNLRTSEIVDEFADEGFDDELEMFNENESEDEGLNFL